MKESRVLWIQGEPFVSVNDLKARLNTDECIFNAAAVAKVGYESHAQDGPIEIMRRAIAAFFFDAVGQPDAKEKPNG